MKKLITGELNLSSLFIYKILQTIKREPSFNLRILFSSQRWFLYVLKEDKTMNTLMHQLQPLYYGEVEKIITALISISDPEDLYENESFTSQFIERFKKEKSLEGLDILDFYEERVLAFIQIEKWGEHLILLFFRGEGGSYAYAVDAIRNDQREIIGYKWAIIDGELRNGFGYKSESALEWARDYEDSPLAQNIPVYAGEADFQKDNETQDELCVSTEVPYATLSSIKLKFLNHLKEKNFKVEHEARRIDASVSFIFESLSYEPVSEFIAQQEWEETFETRKGEQK